MMTYNQVSNGLENRISKVQAKAKAVRFFYFLGSLLLTVAAFFPHPVRDFRGGHERRQLSGVPFSI